MSASSPPREGRGLEAHAANERRVRVAMSAAIESMVRGGPMEVSAAFEALAVARAERDASAPWAADTSLEDSFVRAAAGVLTDARRLLSSPADGWPDAVRPACDAARRRVDAVVDSPLHDVAWGELERAISRVARTASRARPRDAVAKGAPWYGALCELCGLFDPIASLLDFRGVGEAPVARAVARHMARLIMDAATERARLVVGAATVWAPPTGSPPGLAGLDAEVIIRCADERAAAFGLRREPGQAWGAPEWVAPWFVLSRASDPECWRLCPLQVLALPTTAPARAPLRGVTIPRSYEVDALARAVGVSEETAWAVVQAWDLRLRAEAEAAAGAAQW